MSESASSFFMYAFGSACLLVPICMLLGMVVIGVCVVTRKKP